MKRISILGALLLTSASYNPSPLLQTWLEFPIYRLPTIESDQGIQTIYKSNSRQKRIDFFNAKYNLIDLNNMYANFSLGDDGYLEFIVWKGSGSKGAVAANRYRGDQQKFSLWFTENYKIRSDATHILQVAEDKAVLAYKALTGKMPTSPLKIHWEFPRKGTSVIASLQPTDANLLSKCKSLRTNEYDCGNKLDVTRFDWINNTFKTVWLVRF